MPLMRFCFMLLALILELNSRKSVNNVRGQISEHVSAPKGGYCLCKRKTVRRIGFSLISKDGIIDFFYKHLLHSDIKGKARMLLSRTATGTGALHVSDI